MNLELVEDRLLNEVGVVLEMTAVDLVEEVVAVVLVEEVVTVVVVPEVEHLSGEVMVEEEVHH